MNRTGPATEPADRSRPVDQYGRTIFQDRDIPDPFTETSRFAQWRGRTCGPWEVYGERGDQFHRAHCQNGWIVSGDWNFVCGRCHPTAVTNHEGRCQG